MSNWHCSPMNPQIEHLSLKISDRYGWFISLILALRHTLQILSFIVPSCLNLSSSLGTDFLQTRHIVLVVLVFMTHDTKSPRILQRGLMLIGTNRLASVRLTISLGTPDTSPVGEAFGEPHGCFEQSHTSIEGIVLLEFRLFPPEPVQKMDGWI